MSSSGDAEEGFKPRPPNPNEPTLVWKMSQSREMFKTYRLWPSFVGARVESAVHGPAGAPNKASIGLLPVVVWPEQEAYLRQQGVDITTSKGLDTIAEGGSSSSAGKKRKRDASADDEDNDDGDNNNNDKKKNGDEEAEKTKDESAPAKRTRTVEKTPGMLARVGGFFWNALTAPLRATGLIAPKKFSNKDMQEVIFKACADLDYFIGPGDVYGGDYNIYRGGDPSNSHSTATIRVVRKRTITGRELLAFSRVQNQVAKSAVLAYVDPSDHKAQFLVANFRNVSERV